MGMMARKDAAGFMEMFGDIAEMIITVPVPGTDNGWPPAELANIALEQGFMAIACKNVSTALAASQRVSRLGGEGPARILICGSLYLAGHVLGKLTGEGGAE